MALRTTGGSTGKGHVFFVFFCQGKKGSSSHYFEHLSCLKKGINQQRTASYARWMDSFTFLHEFTSSLPQYRTGYCQSCSVYSCHCRLRINKTGLHSMISYRDVSSTFRRPTDGCRKAPRGGEQQLQQSSGTEGQEWKLKEGQTPLLAAASGEEEDEEE